MQAYPPQADGRWVEVMKAQKPYQIDALDAGKGLSPKKKTHPSCPAGGGDSGWVTRTFILLA